MTDSTLHSTSKAHAPDTTPSPQDELEQLLYIITHDLRAGFRAFRTIPDWIAEDLSPLPPDRQALLDGHIAMLRTQAERCDRMLVDLRTFSRVGRCADPDADHPLRPILTEASGLVPLPDSFTLHCDHEAILRGPRNEFIELFTALLSNAVKHHDHTAGHIALHLTAGQSGPAQPRPRVQVIVSDDGPGIPARFHEVVFDLLRTLRPRDDCEGSGMGLAVARKIVTNLGGTIAIHDTGAARGTFIAFSLPGHLVAAPSARPH